MAAAAIPLITTIAGAVAAPVVSSIFGPKEPKAPSLPPPPQAPQVSQIQDLSQKEVPKQTAEDVQRRRTAASSSVAGTRSLNDDFTAGVRVKSLLGE